MSSVPPETLQRDIYGTERKAGLCLLVAVGLLLFLLRETHLELMEGEVPALDRWFVLSAGVL